MISTLKRSWRPAPKFGVCSQNDSAEVLTEVMVKNPSTKKLEPSSVYMLKEIPPIEPKLRGSDFSLKVQLENGVNLRDCGKYLEPTVEEYDSLFRGFAGNLQSQKRVVVSQQQLKESQTSVESSKSE